MNTVPDKKEIDQLLARAFRGSHSGVIITDHLGFTLWVNASIEKVTGYKLSEFLNKKPGVLLQGPETKTEDIQIVSENIRKGKPFVKEILNYSKKGVKMWLNLQIFPLKDQSGKITHFIGIQHDISELVEKNEKLENFNYAVSHNLITQSNNIKSLTNLISKQEGVQSNKYLDLLKMSADRLSDTLKGLRTLLNFKKLNDLNGLPMDTVLIHELVSRQLNTLKTHYPHFNLTVVNQIGLYL
ncbi:MAG: PAS domain-containing protein [Bacteroidota bacterium]